MSQYTPRLETGGVCLMKIVPRNDTVLVQLDKRVDKVGGVHLPTPQGPKELPSTGVIREVGPASTLQTGVRVFISKHGGIPVVLNDPSIKTDDLVLYRDAEILAILTETSQ